MLKHTRARPSRLGMFLSLLIGSAVGTFGFWLLTDLWLSHPVSAAFRPLHGVFVPEQGANLSQSEHDWINRLMENGKIASPDNIMSQTMAFYDVIIAVLVTILAVLGAVSYIYIRGTSELHAEAAASSVARRLIEERFGSLEFDERLRVHVDQRVTQPLNELEQTIYHSGTINENFEEISSRINSLEDGFAAIEAKLSRLDQNDQLEGQVEDDANGSS